MNIGDKMLKGVFWSSIEKISVQLISFLLTIVLARLLTPGEYGTIGLLIVFISISQVFIDGGFSKALIQKQNRSQEDISTVFFCNLIIAIFCYCLLWLISPYVQDFYGIKNLSSLLRVLAISLIFNGLFAIPNTLLSIDMNFKLLSKVTLISTIISGVIAIVLAYNNFGEWALVWQSLLRAVLMAILFWFLVKWRPKLVFSKSSFKSLFSFGSKLLIGSLLNNLTNNFSSLFIAKIINTQQLGYYTRGTQNADVPFSTMNTVLNTVLLPGLAPLQNDKKELIKYTKYIIKSSALIVFPIFIGLAATSKPLVLILLTEKWSAAIPIMQLICLARAITVISGVNVNLLYVIGRSDLALKQQYYKIGVRLIFLIVALPYGIIMVAIAELSATIVHFFINTYYPGKIMGYGSKNQIRDVSKILFITATMGIIVGGISFIVKNPWISIFTSFVFAIPFYLFMLKVLKIKEFQILFSKITGMISKNYKKK